MAPDNWQEHLDRAELLASEAAGIVKECYLNSVASEQFREMFADYQYSPIGQQNFDINNLQLTANDIEYLRKMGISVSNCQLAAQ